MSSPPCTQTATVKISCCGTVKLISCDKFETEISVDTKHAIIIPVQMMMHEMRMIFVLKLRSFSETGQVKQVIGTCLTCSMQKMAKNLGFVKK